MKTAQGDTWDYIAWRELGDARYADQLINVNRDKIETQIFEGGVELELPTVERTVKEVLPPWKR